MNPGSCRWLLSGLVLLLAGVGGAQEKENQPDKDKRLVAAVRSAAMKQIAPEKVEALVGTPATINTHRKIDRDAFALADIDKDPDEGPCMPARKTLRFVVYWVRPLPDRNPRIVGIAWPKKGKPHIFFGQVLPPG